MLMIRLSIMLVGACIAAAVTPPAPAAAEVVRIAWTGTVDRTRASSFSDPSANTTTFFKAGDPASGVLWFERGRSGSVTSPGGSANVRVYGAVPSALSLTFGTSTWHYEDLRLTVLDDAVLPATGVKEDAFYFNDGVLRSGPVLGGLTGDSFSFGLGSPDTSVLSGLQMPDAGQIAALFADYGLDPVIKTRNYFFLSDSSILYYTIDSLTATVVPLPPAVALLVGALASLGLMAQHRRRA